MTVFGLEGPAPHQGKTIDLALIKKSQDVSAGEVVLPHNWLELLGKVNSHTLTRENSGVGSGGSGMDEQALGI